MSPHPRRGFGELEAVIMGLLWAHGSATVRELHTRLEAERELAYTTVMTVLDNLHRKGWTSREREGRAYRYTPTHTQEEYVATLMREALTHTSNRSGAFAHFVADIDTTDAAILRNMLAQDAHG